mmetsp:Transcript_72572/g.216588  ORF Transcript_72572/g.216588 Transcript_72572/m.216588 type:complete len:305 (-) Transcript_72572:44-958(-)
MQIFRHALPLLVAVASLPGAVGWAGPSLAASPGVPVGDARAASTAPVKAPAAQRLRGSGAPAAAKEPLAAWARGLLAAIAMAAVVAVGAPRAARAEGGSVNVFFGQGCFWHVQHELVKKETNALGRQGGDITALAGYAGGLKAGDKGRVCYHNLALAPDYGQLGHTEVVNVSVPEEKVGDFAKDYFDAASKYPFGRADPQDRGTEYRSAIGLPGGMDGPLYKQIEAANNGRMQLLAGKGNDADTVGTKKVWIYDSDKFPFYQGEVYHQFHDDMLERYSDPYHKLKGTLLDSGKLRKVECPELGF